MAEEPSILVVGSINMDLLVRSPRTPQPGETILGNNFKTLPGGKGANQAVAVARMGGNCKMIACVGKDTFGEQLLENLKDEGVDCDAVTVTPFAPTGVAMIVVDSIGENTIIVAGGANSRVTPDDNIYPNEELFANSAVVLLQLELPLPTVLAAIKMARKHGCKVILDPAPAPRNIPEELCMVDIISPNVSEAEIITGMKASPEERPDKQIASELIARGAKVAVLKLGARGSLAVDCDGHFYTVPSYKVQVEDTTGAGDAFTGGLAAAIARGDGLHNAVKFANAAGALACTQIGAQSAIPTADEVKLLMEDQPT